MKHTCHATECATEVPPEKLMCATHWRMVPWSVQQVVLSEYRGGQCQDKKPSRRWVRAVMAAKMHIRLKQLEREIFERLTERSRSQDHGGSA
jgi:hypothetical protein